MIPRERPRKETPERAPAVDPALAPKPEEIQVLDLEIDSLIGAFTLTVGPEDILEETRSTLIVTKPEGQIVVYRRHLVRFSKRLRTIVTPAKPFVPPLS